MFTFLFLILRSTLNNGMDWNGPVPHDGDVETLAIKTELFAETMGRLNWRYKLARKFINEDVQHST